MHLFAARKEKQDRSDVCLDVLIDHPRLRAAFLDFAHTYTLLPEKSRASSALMVFLEARAISTALTVGGGDQGDNEFDAAALPDPRWRTSPRKRGEAFYARHVGPGAPLPFALDQSTRDALALVLSFEKKGGWRMTGAIGVTRAPFQQAASQAYQRLKFEVMPQFLKSDDFRRLEVGIARRRGSVPASASSMDGRIAPAVRALLTAGKSGRDAADSFLASARIATTKATEGDKTDGVDAESQTVALVGAIVAPARALLRKMAALWWAHRQYKTTFDETKEANDEAGLGDEVGGNNRNVRTSMLEVQMTITQTLEATGCTTKAEDNSVISALVDNIDVATRLLAVLKVAAGDADFLLKECPPALSWPRELFDEAASQAEVLLGPHIESFFQSDAGAAFENTVPRRHTTALSPADLASSAERSRTFTGRHLPVFFRPARSAFDQMRPRRRSRVGPGGSQSRSAPTLLIPSEMSPEVPSPDAENRSLVAYDRRVMLLHAFRHDLEVEHVRGLYSEALKRTRAFRGSETLREEALCTHLLRFAALENSTENVNCLIDLIALRDQFTINDQQEDSDPESPREVGSKKSNKYKDEPTLLSALQNLRSEYISETATQPLNISAKVSKTFKKRMHDVETASGIDDAIDAPLLDWLMPLEKEITRLVKTDMYPRFLKSEVYEDYRREVAFKFSRQSFRGEVGDKVCGLTEPPVEPTSPKSPA